MLTRMMRGLFVMPTKIYLHPTEWSLFAYFWNLMGRVLAIVLWNCCFYFFFDWGKLLSTLRVLESPTKVQLLH